MCKNIVYVARNTVGNICVGDSFDDLYQTIIEYIEHIMWPSSFYRFITIERCDPYTVVTYVTNDGEKLHESYFFCKLEKNKMH